LDEVRNSYSPKNHPDVLSGKNRRWSLSRIFGYITISF
jgi:hypothetical protein